MFLVLNQPLCLGGLPHAPLPHHTGWASETTSDLHKDPANDSYHGFTDLEPQEDLGPGSRMPGRWPLVPVSLVSVLFPSLCRWAWLSPHTTRLPHGSRLLTVHSVQSDSRTSREKVIQLPLDVPPQFSQLWRLRLGPLRQILGGRGGGGRVELREVM